MRFLQSLPACSSVSPAKTSMGCAAKRVFLSSVKNQNCAEGTGVSSRWRTINCFPSAAIHQSRSVLPRWVHHFQSRTTGRKQNVPCPGRRLSTDQWNRAERRSPEMMGRSTLLANSCSCALPTQTLLWANPLTTPRI